MGTTTLIDLAGSFLVSGLLLLTALQLDQKSIQTTYDSQAGLTVQQNMVELIEYLQYDFRKIGYCKNPARLPSSAVSTFVQKGDTSTIWFLADASNSGNVDTVKYWLGTTAIPGCPNPDVRLLYRQVDSNPPVASNLGITEFKIQYFEAFGIPIPTPFGAPNRTQYIVLAVRMEPISAFNADYSSNFVIWRQTRMVSRNLKR
ncbi:MAG: hypothetical protein M1378_13830 [Bacteroidetes bacterium]|nr:hypothetical protein [Bacteroidota bacterium]